MAERLQHNMLRRCPFKSAVSNWSLKGCVRGMHFQSCTRVPYVEPLQVMQLLF